MGIRTRVAVTVAAAVVAVLAAAAGGLLARGQLDRTAQRAAPAQPGSPSGWKWG